MGSDVEVTAGRVFCECGVVSRVDEVEDHGGEDEKTSTRDSLAFI